MTADVVVGRSTQRSGRRSGFVVAIASMGFFLITLDISIVNVALTRIQQELGGGTVAQQWIIDGYTLLFAALLLFAGNLADRIGPKRALLLGIAGFGVTSAVCAFAPTFAVLIAARCVQGAAAAIMLPASMALIRERYPDPARRARALGVWAVGGAVAGLLGPPLGGFLTTIDWRWVFSMNLPVCAAMLIFLATVTSSVTRPSPFDWPGQLLAVIGLAGLVWGLIEGGHAGFGTPAVIAALVIAALALTGFVVTQARVPHPMMPLTLFEARSFRLALPVGFAFMVGHYGSVFVLSLFLQQQLGLSPLQAGLVFLPSAGFAVVSNLASGPVANRFGPRVPIVGGLLTMAAGLAGLAATAAPGGPIAIAVCLSLMGAGGAIAMPSMTAVVLDDVPAHLAGTASAVFNTFRQIGGAVAIAVFGAFLATVNPSGDGVRLSLGIAAALVAAAAINSLRVDSSPRSTS